MRMDVVTGAVVIVGLQKAGGAAADLVKEFLGRVLAPSADAVGQVVATPVVEWQKRRAATAALIVEEAASTLAAAGRDPQPVPGRLLWPILERGSVEEDKDLHRMWVALLANAAVSPGDIPPSFPHILGELSPVEAVVLENLYIQEGDRTQRIDYKSDHPTARFNPSHLKIRESDGSVRVVELPFSNYRVMADNLMRLGLVEQQYSGGTVRSRTAYRVYGELHLTPLGHHFVASLR